MMKRQEIINRAQLDFLAARITASGRRSCIAQTRAEAGQEREERTLDTLVSLCERRHEKGRITGMPEQHAVAIAKFPERVAAIIGKTFAVIGPDAFDERKGLSDDQAVSMIADLLHDLDPGLIERNQNKRLATLRRAS